MPVVRATLSFDTDTLRKPWLVMTGFALLSTWFVLANYGISGYPIGGDAQAFWTMIHAELRRFTSIAWPGPGLGVNGSELLPLVFPLLTIALALDHLGISGGLLPRVIYIAFTFSMLSGTYVLVRCLLSSRVAEAHRDVAAVAGALLYGFNTWTIVASSAPPVDQTLTTAVLPWAAWVAVHGVGNGIRAGAALVALGMLFAGVGNPARFAIVPVTMIVVALACGWETRRLGRAVGVALVGIVLGLGCCLWWLLPLTTVAGAGLHAEALQSVDRWLAWMSERSTLLHLFKLDGGVIFDDLPHNDWYASPVGNLLGYVPIVIALLGLGRVRRRLSVGLFLAFIAAIMLSKGAQPPFGGAFVFLIERLPGFAIFRSPYDKWIPIAALMLSVLFAFGIAVLVQDVQRALTERRWGDAWPVPATVATLASTAVLVYAWPALAGQNVKLLPPGHSFVGDVPTAYRGAVRYLHRLDPAARVIIFNEGGPPYPRFRWGYIGEDPLLTLSRNPISPFGDLIAGFAQIEPAELASAFRRLNARFVIVHRDVENPEDSPDVGRLVRAGVMRRLITLSYLDLYELTQPPDPFVQVPAAVFRIGPSPFAGAGDTEASIGIPAFGAAWSALLTYRGAPADLVYARRPAKVLGEAREVRPSAAGTDDRMAVQTAPGESLYYVPTAALTDFTAGIGCAGDARRPGPRDGPAARAASAGRELRTLPDGGQPRWQLDGWWLPLVRPTECRQASRARSAARETPAGIIALGASRSAQRWRLEPVAAAGGRRDDLGRRRDRPVRWNGPVTRFGGATGGEGALRVADAGIASIDATGRLDPRDAYDLALTYDAEGAVFLRYADERVMQDVFLRADGKPHSAVIRIFPTRLDGGRYTLSLHVEHGAIDLFRSVLTDAGPNGVFIALKPAAAPNVASIASLRWQFPGGAEFRLRGCRECVVAAGINGDGRWTIAPAGVAADSLVGMGEASGGFGAFSPGRAEWVIAGSEDRQLTLVYGPIVRFRLGVVLSSAAVAVVIALGALGLRRRRGLMVLPTGERVAPATALHLGAAALFLAVSPIVDVLPARVATAVGEALLVIALLAAVQQLLVPLDRFKRPAAVETV